MPESISADLPANVALSSRAERDLKGLTRKHPREVLRIVQDVARLALKFIPVGQYKNPDSLFWALEMFGYGIVGLGTWFAAPVLGRTGRDAAIRPFPRPGGREGT